jgi:hypothetical protein
MPEGVVHGGCSGVICMMKLGWIRRKSSEESLGKSSKEGFRKRGKYGVLKGRSNKVRKRILLYLGHKAEITMLGEPDLILLHSNDKIKLHSELGHGEQWSAESRNMQHFANDHHSSWSTIQHGTEMHRANAFRIDDMTIGYSDGDNMSCVVLEPVSVRSHMRGGS